MPANLADINRIMHRATRLIEAAARLATREGRNRVENIQLHTEGFAEPGYRDEAVVALGNWNTVGHWDKDAQRHVDTDDVMKRLGDALERAGVDIQWEDEWASCNACGKLVRTSADSYSWQPSYTCDDGELACIECVEADGAEHFARLEGDENSANTIDTLDPAAFGYVLVEDSLESGWHPGQDASPKVIAESLRWTLAPRARARAA